MFGQRRKRLVYVSGPYTHEGYNQHVQQGDRILEVAAKHRRQAVAGDSMLALVSCIIHRIFW